MLKGNDGLLAEHISSVEKITFSQALNFLNTYAQDVLQQLKDGKKVKVESIGTLAMGAEKNIVFEPDNSRNLLLDSFGLENIQALPVKRDERKKEKEIFVNRDSKPGERKNTLRKIAPYATIPLLLLLLWLPFATGIIKEEKINFSRINPFYHAPNPVYQPAQLYEPFMPPARYVSLFDYEAEGRTIKYSFVENSVADSATQGIIVRLGSNRKSETQPERIMVKTETPIPSGNKYHIIGGAFRYNDLAELFLAELKKKGFNAYFLNEPGQPLQKVCYEGFSSRRAAFQRLEEIQRINPDAWVYKK